MGTARGPLPANPHGDAGPLFLAVTCAQFYELIPVVRVVSGKLRDELLEREAFDTLLETKVLIERWRQHYNTIRPHSALRYRPPAPEALQPCAVATPPQPHNRGGVLKHNPG